VSQDSIAESEKLRKHFAEPMSAQEKYSSRNNSSAAAQAFFEPRANTKKKAPPATTTASFAGDSPSSVVDADVLYHEVVARVNESSFGEAHAGNKAAPLAMLATMASVVVERIIRPNRPNKGTQLKEFFIDLTFTVPPAPGDILVDPNYHSIVGQKLLLVDWHWMFGLAVPCPWMLQESYIIQ
jgi:hypothetical protein